MLEAPDSAFVAKPFDTFRHTFSKDDNIFDDARKFTLNLKRRGELPPSQADVIFIDALNESGNFVASLTPQA